jgi:hypothetical protein
MKDQPPAPPEAEVILLTDLAPRETVKGGAGKLIFGQPLEAADDDRPTEPGGPPDGRRQEKTGPAGSKNRSGRR